MPRMDIVDHIRQANSDPEILSALSDYAGTLGDITAIPDWCVAPLKDGADVRARIPALLGVIGITSQRLLDRDCESAKHALRAFVAASNRLG